MSLSRWLPDFGRGFCTFSLPIILPNEQFYNPIPFRLPLRSEIFLCDKRVVEVGTLSLAITTRTSLYLPRA